MPDLSTLLRLNTDLQQWLDQHTAAMDVQYMIDLHGVQITLGRGSQTVAAQTVVVTTPSGAGETQNRAGGQAAISKVMLVGTDTFDIQRGDTFKLYGDPHRVTFVDRATPGMVVAYADVAQ